MRADWLAGLAGAALLLTTPAAQAQVNRGNDTGGIISWSCEAEADAPAIATEFCARFDKYARITSVARRYGDYISFNCLWSAGKTPFSIPAVRTRSTCAIRNRPRPVDLRDPD
jgi:hypothetical protein